MATARTVLRLPPSPKAGSVIELSVLIAHPMETGYRVDAEGRPLPRNIIRRFSCQFEAPGAAPEPWFSADLYPAIAANPYLAFSAVATASGTLRFTWEGDFGFRHEETAALVVT
jgi:sulfur-oxidizing protein SoxZ